MNDFPSPHDSRDREDERLRRLLDDAVSDIEPRDALGSIHARTKERPMSSRRSWLLGAGTAVVATAATVLAVAVVGDDGTTDGPGFAGPTVSGPPVSGSTAEKSDGGTSPSGPTADGSADAARELVPVYYVGNTTRGPRLFREFHPAPAGVDPVSTAVAAAVGGSAEGPPVLPRDPDYRSAWPAGTTASAGFDGDVITVNLGGDPEASLRDRPAQMAASEARLAVEQLLYTAQGVVQERAPVQLLLYGERSDRVLGVPASEPLAQGDPGDVLAQVWIIDPADATEMTAPFTVSGLAAAYEATVEWELRQGDRVVKRGFTTAEECCTMAPYSFQVNAPPGDYTIVVHDTDPSGGEGPGVWEDTKELTIVP
jgi:hypothetical protein